MTAAFVGREPELAALRAALDDARGAVPRTVVVEGAAGIGKTVLLRRVVAGTEGAVVLWAAGREEAASVSFAVLDQLRAAAGAAPVEPGTEALGAGAGLLELLGDLQDRGVVVAAVDDAHWADTSSLQALTFALRRLRVDRVLAVLATREEEGRRLPAGLWRLAEGETGTRLRLGGLGADELRRLAGALGKGALPAAGARRLHRHTGGNPLHVTALLDEIGPEVLAGAGPLPAPRSYAEVVLERLGSCSAEARALVEAGAVLGGRFPLALAGTVAGVPDPLAAAEEATAARLLAPEADPLWVGFAHPLVRAAVHHHLDPDRLAALHLRAAEESEDEGGALRHRAAAAPGPDPELAAALEDFARRQDATGGWAAAADAVLSAARLTPRGPGRERLLVRAVEILLWSLGNVAEASAVAEGVEAWVDKAASCLVRAWRARFSGPPGVGVSLYARARDACGPDTDPELAQRIAWELAMHSLVDGRGEEAVAEGRRAFEAKGYADPLLVLGLASVGRAHEALDLVASLPDPLPDIRGTPDATPLVSRGIVRRFVDDLEGSRRDLETCLRLGRRRAPVDWLSYAAYHLADTEYRLGRWDESTLHAELALSVWDDAFPRWYVAERRGVAAYALAGRGDPAAAAHARAAREAAEDLAGTLRAAVAGARVAQAAGDAAAQAAACEPLLAYAGRDLVDEPGIEPWRDLYAEALVALGRPDEADAALVVLEVRAADHHLASARAAAARARGLVEAARGDTGRAEAAFEAALANASCVEMPFLRAQCALAYGAFLRRQGRHRAAAGRLRSARSLLDRLGARPYLERCDAELAGLGLAPAPAPGTAPRLSPHERLVAGLVATGASNREVAAELVLSVKTVEYHLGKVFTKLGVRSRAQLAARLAEPLVGAARD